MDNSGEETSNKFPENTHPGNQPDVYVRCPYFPEHELRKSRLPYHLIKCQKNPHAPKLVACPFNYLHRIKPENKQDHILLCEDRVFTRYHDREPPSYKNTLRKVFGITDEPKKATKSDLEEEEGQEEWWS